MSKSLNLNFRFDSNLREVVEKPGDVELHIATLLASLPEARDKMARSKILAEAGTYLRMLGKLSDAQRYLEEAVELLGNQSDSRRQLLAQKIRLAHVYQWQGNFQLSDAIFNDLIRLELRDGVREISDFIWQHAGKNYFDQGKYAKALEAFEKAFDIRMKNGSSRDLLDSTLQSIAETQKRLK